MKLLILGAQGSGKGTQAELISKEFSIPHISTGDLFRENIRNNTSLGVQAKKFMNKGELVPDRITNSMVKARLLNDDCKAGFILDGYPRTLDQMKELAAFADIDTAIDIEISDDEAITRIGGRLVCKNCGAGYHINYKKPRNTGVCDTCGGELARRSDDEPDAVVKRLKIYHEQTQPITDFFRQKNSLKVINGSQSIEEVFKDIKLMLKRRF